MKILHRILLVVLIGSCSLMAPESKGQTASGSKISVDIKDQSLKSALSIIQKASGLQVTYNEDLVAAYKKVDLTLTNVSLTTVMDRLLQSTALKYQITGNKIIILPKQENRPALQGKHFISGKVVDERNEPLPGATVKIAELNSSISTDSEGLFKIEADEGVYTLGVSFLSYESKTIQNVSTGPREILIVLQSSSQQLQNVVVTALGIKREEKSLGYAVTKIEGEEISKTAPNNWVNALSGKVPGLNISKAGTGPGGSVRITLRGQNSLDLDKGEPLIVIDGVPVTSGMIGNNGISYGATGNTETPVDYGNALSDINPEDIHDVTILRGPSAAALYGSRAASGAILITTKSNNQKKDRIAVAFTSSVTFDDVLHYPDFQYEFGSGNAGKHLYYSFGASPDGPSTHSSRSFGPKFEGQQFYQYDPETQTTGTAKTPWLADKNYVKDAFNRGVTYNNTVSVTGGDTKNAVRFSYNDLRNEHILPNTGYSFNRLSFSSNSKLNKFQLSTRVNYYHKGSDNLPLSGYNSNTYMYALMYGAANIPFSWNSNYWAPGKEGIDQNNRLNPAIDNPYFTLYESLNTVDYDRIFGSITAVYSFNKKMNLQLRGGTDQSTSFRTFSRPYSSVRFAVGRYQEQHVVSREQNFDFLYKYDEKLSKNVGLVFSAGGSVTYQQTNNTSTLAERLSYPAMYTLANAKDRPLVDPERSKKEVQSLYGLTQLSYKTFAFLDLSGRNDWSSALPKENCSYFYYSASGSLVVSEMLKLANKNVLSFLKLRGSIAQVGNDTSPYRTTLYYTNSDFGGSYNNPTVLPGGKNLKPEIITNREAGADIRFLNSRLNLDLTYYNSNSENQILEVPIDPATGYQRRVFNAALINNTGWELALSSSPLSKNSNLKWKTTITWSTNRSEIRELSPGVESIIMATGPRGYIEARVGGAIGDIYGSGYLRSPDGQIVNDASGYPIVDTENMKFIGSAVPDWKAGIQNQLSFKNWSFGFLFDGQKGGDIYSFSNSVLAGNGKLTSTLPGRYEGLIGEGVQQNADGSYRPNDVLADAAGYYNAKYLRDNVEANTFDASYIKLREANLEFRFSPKTLKALHVRGASLSIYGRDLLLFTTFPLYDPEIATLNRNRIEPGFETGQFPSTRSFGTTLKVSF
ncbi:SusC/RagA family TonB-linked outer membrane protein [Desertivirga xinjiangensis]|uniref:SusC/RagA family TonB-linked outer membrane protein n=1 Tax=Desertivirga xinjiangensis TaxID=539206 RepID=UPI00210DA672|nr:SusC/RagA family TonB-linked outer membrane protein [Pedobacter xinjiangensis]